MKTLLMNEENKVMQTKSLDQLGSGNSLRVNDAVSVLHLRMFIKNAFGHPVLFDE